MTYTTPEERVRFIAGLRELASFLDSNSTIPAPVYTTVYVFPSLDSSDTDRRAEVDVIASRICTQAHETVPGHYVASRFFGPVEYRAVAIDHEKERD